MSDQIPGNFRDLFQKKAFGQLGTIMKDGTPQVTPVWVDLQDGHVIVNSAKGRQKDKNIERDPRVTITVIDPTNPYRYVEIRGRVDETTQQGADTHIDKMAKKYLGKDTYPFRQPGEVRVMYKIAPQHVGGFN